MTETSIKSLYDTTEFSTAEKNMRYDDTLTQNLGPQTRVFRLYTWKNPSVTYAHKQELPEDLQHIDHGKRITGGGILFHKPGDMSFSCSADLKDPLFPKKLKEKMQVISMGIDSVFLAVGIRLKTEEEKQGSDNRNFCRNYPNPYERYYEGEKVLALTLRKFKDRFIIQGNITLGEETESFTTLDGYQSQIGHSIALKEKEKVALKKELAAYFENR